MRLECVMAGSARMKEKEKWNWGEGILGRSGKEVEDLLAFYHYGGIVSEY